MESENGNRTMGRIRTMIRPSPAPVLHPLPFYLETTRGRIAPVLHPMHPFFAPAGAIVHCIKKVVQSQRTCKLQVLFFGFGDENARFAVSLCNLMTSPMAAAKLVHQRANEEISRQIMDYILNMESQFTVYRTGLLSHNGLKIGEWKWDLKAQLRRLYCTVTKGGVTSKRKDRIEYERAYHLFSLYAFAWLYLFYPEANIFRSKKFVRLKQFGLTEDNFVSFSKKNMYAYGYNSPAYELPFVKYVFGTGDDEQCAENLLKQHQLYNIAPDGCSYTENVPDSVTLDARIYEIMQYYKLKEDWHE